MVMNKGNLLIAGLTLLGCRMYNHGRSPESATQPKDKSDLRLGRVVNARDGIGNQCNGCWRVIQCNMILTGNGL